MRELTEGKVANGELRIGYDGGTVSTTGGAHAAGKGYSNRGDESKGVPTIEDGECRVSEPSSMRGFSIDCGGAFSGDSLTTSVSIARPSQEREAHL